MHHFQSCWYLLACLEFDSGVNKQYIDNGLDKALAPTVNKPLSKPAMTSFHRCMDLLLGLLELSPCNTKYKMYGWPKNPHWTYVHIYELQLQTKCQCHKLHKLDNEKFKRLQKLNRHLILPNHIVKKIKLCCNMAKLGTKLVSNTLILSTNVYS